jgi:hypothetical protein
MIKRALSFPLLELYRREWARSKGFRWLVIGSLVYLLLRLVIQLALLFDPASQEIAADLQTYLNAARAFQQHQGLYLPGTLQVVNFYQYAPFYALTFIPFLGLSPLGAAVVHTLLHLAAYGLFYLAWGRIFHTLGLEKAEHWMAWSLPVWVVFSGFWGDLAYLNIYLIVALLATLLIEALLKEQLGWSAVWLVLLLQVKPHWAFAALVPLLMGRRAFFFKLMGLAAAGYAGTLLVTLALGGSYAWQQYLDYFRFLPRLSASFPWRGPEAGFLGYNHSVKQVVVFWLGVSPGTLALADGIKLLLLVPLGGVALLNALRPTGQPVWKDPRRFLDLAFALYLGAFLWLDMVWELSLGIALFVYLLATLESRWSKTAVWAVFLLYALLDFWQLASYLALGPQILIQDAYVATDPSIYAPVILLVILVFYGILTYRLWAASALPRSKPLWNLKPF